MGTAQLAACVHGELGETGDIPVAGGIKAPEVSFF